MGADVRYTQSRYEELLCRLLEGRRDGTLDEQAEDELLCAMDDCWWGMPESDREAVERIAIWRRYE